MKPVRRLRWQRQENGQISREKLVDISVTRRLKGGGVVNPYSEMSINEIKEMLSKQGWILYFLGNEAVCFRSNKKIEASGDTLLEAIREVARKARELDK